MSVMVEELYTALRQIPGLSDEQARAAARAVVSAEQTGLLATKADLAQLETRVIKWNVGTMGLLTIIYGAINVLLRVL
jgi:hypothetical protein